MDTHKGLYSYRRLIYGISSAAAVFQCTMDRIFQGIPNDCYIDDILIKGVDVMSCKETLMRVLERLDKHNVRRKLAECGFFRSSIDYLGQVISNGNRTTSPIRVAQILSAKVP